jgi:hypothetical protein
VAERFRFATAGLTSETKRIPWAAVECDRRHHHR